MSRSLEVLIDQLPCTRAMSDVLALLAELDKADKKTKPTDVKANTKKNAL